MIATLRSNPPRWAPVIFNCWRLRIPLIRHVLIMKLNYYICRKTISTRLLTVDARAGSAAALQNIRTLAGYGSVDFENKSSSPPPPVLDATIRELALEAEIYDARYMVRLAADRHHVKRIDSVVHPDTCQIHTHMLRPRVSGNTFDSLCVSFTTPWKLATTGSLSISDGRPCSEDNTTFTVSATGIDDEKKVDTFFPARALRLLEGYNLSSEYIAVL